jgi:hypothetical protein
VLARARKRAILYANKAAQFFFFWIGGVDRLVI